MFCDFRLPLINPQMANARVECLYAGEGEFLRPGSRLLDLSVDLSSAFAHECPPVSYFRIVLREPLWLRCWALGLGDLCPVDGLIARFSTEADEADGGGTGRQVRVNSAGIIYHDGMWSGRA